MQGFYCGTTYWREPNDVRPISAPRKMVRPDIVIGMEQRDDAPGKRIACFKTPGFVAIARGTTQAQIVQLGAPPSTAWNDVVYFKGNPHHVLGAQAIRAPVLRRGQDSPPERLRNTSHVSGLEQA
jgi:hypothetical protein